MPAQDPLRAFAGEGAGPAARGDREGAKGPRRRPPARLPLHVGPARRRINATLQFGAGVIAPPDRANPAAAPSGAASP